MRQASPRSLRNDLPGEYLLCGPPGQTVYGAGTTAIHCRNGTRAAERATTAAPPSNFRPTVLSKSSIGEVGPLAGNRPNVAGFKNETAGPSDGIILVDSAVQAPKDARVTSSQVLPCNHLELVLGAAAQQIIADFLASP